MLLEGTNRTGLVLCLKQGVEDDAVKWAFWKAATFKSPAMMKVILEKGTDINARDKDGNRH